MDSVHKSNKVHKFSWNTWDVRNQAPLIEKKKTKNTQLNWCASEYVVLTVFVQNQKAVIHSYRSSAEQFLKSVYLQT